MKKIAVYPGTFDPITKGHSNIISRASKIVDNLIVAVAKDTGKNSLFSQEERTNLVKIEVQELKLNNVKVLPFSGLLVDFIKKENIDFIIRGLRTNSDFENESIMASMNRELYNNVETIFLTSLNSTQFISSTLVRQILSLGGDIEKFISKKVKEEILKKIK